MEKGKKKCETLKAIRKEVANANGIEYEPTKCDYEGECEGTCPKCDAELAELQRDLDAKEQKGERVTYDCTLSESRLEQDGESLTDKTQKSIYDDIFSMGIIDFSKDFEDNED